MQAALALILGPETEYQTRVRATRRLMKQGSAILPLVLNTLSKYPEITDPSCHGGLPSMSISAVYYCTSVSKHNYAWMHYSPIH